jgi:hypothetical protein
MKVDKFLHKEVWSDWVGSLITKHSGKPFKGGDYNVIVKAVTTNPHSNKMAFLISDGSIVDCHQCKLVEDDK